MFPIWLQPFAHKDLIWQWSVYRLHRFQPETDYPPTLCSCELRPGCSLPGSTQGPVKIHLSTRRQRRPHFGDESKRLARQRWVSALRFGISSTSANSNQNHYPGAWYWVKGQQSRASPPNPFWRERRMTHQTLVAASWLLSPLSAAPEDSSDWPMIYWTHGDVCLNASVHIRWRKKGSSSRDLGCVCRCLLQFWCAGDVLWKCWEQMSFVRVWKSKTPIKRLILWACMWILLSVKQQQSSAHFNS